MNEIYETKNLNIASYLCASKIVMFKTRRVDRDVYFQFENKEEVEKLVNDYFTGKALINPQDLFARLNDLRDLIFSQ